MNALAEPVAEQRVLSWITANTFEQAQQDVQQIRKDKDLDQTTRERLVAARLGRDFRKDCLIHYPACPITGIAFQPMLRASHIKSTGSACSTGTERLDPYNGIMLAAHIDVLFDQGWMSFEDDGQILISDELGAGSRHATAPTR